ncbi:MAG: SOS response-associated peptidase family protein [Tissierellia bacterium]|nr:SOS response-associated peptidase family protein [Tissierellia bacterium]
MCCRFELSINPKEVGNLYGKNLNIKFQPKKEIFPTDKILCYNGDFYLKTWGIKTDFYKRIIINARSEKISKDGFFDYENRFLIPANGFYEWDINKTKYKIDIGENFSFVAVRSKQSDQLALLTKKSYKNFLKIHDRIPVIVTKNENEAYLNENIKNLKLLIKQNQKNLNIKTISNEQLSFL